MRSAKFRRHALRRLTDDLEAAYTSTLQRGIFEKLFTTYAQRRGFEVRGLVGDVPQVLTRR